MSFMVMYNYATVNWHITVKVSLYHFASFRYCHLLGIWYVFITDMLFSFFFFNYTHDKTYVNIYLKIFRCILVLYTHHI